MKQDYLAKRIGERIKIERLSAGLTQEQLAKKAGMKQSMISQIEHASQRVSIHKMARLALAMDMNLAMFFDGVISDEKVQRQLRRMWN